MQERGHGLEFSAPMKNPEHASSPELRGIQAGVYWEPASLAETASFLLSQRLSLGIRWKVTGDTGCPSLTSETHPFIKYHTHTHKCTHTRKRKEEKNEIRIET